MVGHFLCPCLYLGLAGHCQARGTIIKVKRPFWQLKRYLLFKCEFIHTWTVNKSLYVWEDILSLRY